MSLFLYITYKYYKKTLPTIDDIILKNNTQSINILYSNGVETIKTYNTTSINNLSYNDIPKNLINALIATEDREFFIHSGINYLGILRAMLVNIRYGHFKQGGSTITQQLAKMILEDNKKTLRRKFKELILTNELEKYLTKQDIITLYLSKSYFGAGKYGIKEASMFYFNKDIEELQLEECAMLVGLLKAPTKYNPTNNKELTRDRTTQIILNMKDAGFIKEKDVLNYIIPDLDLDNYKYIKKQAQNYYFSDWVNNYLLTLNIDSKLPEISVITTLDYYIQNKVVSIVNDFINNNEAKLGKSEIAVIIMNKDGEILSMIGGKNYNKSQFNRAIYANRQTGSLFKFFIYITGFENGLKHNDVFIDEPIKIADWYPENNNKKYYGKLTVKDAFKLSSNSIAVQIADYFGIAKVINTAKSLGITSSFKNDLTISLGSQESSLLEMVSAYASIINNGSRVFPHSIKYIISNIDVIFKYDNIISKPAFNKSTVENMQYLMFNVIADGTGKNAQVKSLIDKTNLYNIINRDNKFFIGGKTGSTQNSKDAWFIGFANDIIIGIWIGNDDNTSTNKIMGGNLPAKLWKNIVENII